MVLQTRRFAATLALVAAFTAFAAPAQADQWRGKVVGIADGDTLTLLDANHRQHRIRLDGIDAPEKSQPFGQRSRQSLAQLAHGQEAVADCPKVDRYGRDVCRVTVNGIDVGLEQVRRGLAWHYVRYAREQSPQDRVEYAHAEEKARAERSGLWSTRDPTPPWDYRRAARATTGPS